MLALHGTGVGHGIAIGKARVISRPSQGVSQYTIDASAVDAELSRLGGGIRKARSALLELGMEHGGSFPEEVASLLEAHVTMLDDPTMLEEPSRLVREERVNAEYAVSMYGRRLEAAFSRIQDPYLRSKAVDVDQVVQRIIGALMDSDESLELENGESYDGEIIIAADLAPADTIELKKHRITGFITSLGGPVSHTAILARSMKIPAIVGLHGAVRYLRTGDLLILDGKRGVVLASPDERTMAAYQRRREKILRRRQAMESLRDAESVSLDGQPVSLYSNVELPEEVELSVAQNADGVGLYRTEFLFMNRSDMPDEEEQFRVYRSIVERSHRPVTIRTLDLGADKQVDGGRAGDGRATNPAMGMRAIRLCLHNLALFKPQLRAIYRASVFGSARIMVPMLTNVDELSQLFGLLDEIRNELAESGTPFDPSVPVGGMIEVPAAAVSADIFARKLDFLSIGTNDLIQYTLAIDRTDDEVNYLYDPLHPSILRLVKMVIDSAKAAGIPVSMCGEMAGDPAYTRILLALGLREFSMDPASLLEVKQRVRMSDIQQLESFLPAILGATEPEELRQHMLALNQ
jgi:phosphotransferase system enzyme I (PtsI)